MVLFSDNDKETLVVFSWVSVPGHGEHIWKGSNEREHGKPYDVFTSNVPYMCMK